MHEGVAELRKYQGKPEPTINGKAKVSITSLMAAMAVETTSFLDEKCLIVLDAYFAVGPVFLKLKQAIGAGGERLIHIVTRAKGNVVAYEDPLPKTGKRGRPRRYGPKHQLMNLFDEAQDCFKSTTIDLYGQRKSISYLCLDLIWKPVQEKIRFVLVRDGKERSILMCSDLTLPAPDIILAYGYRFKIEVNFKVLKHLTGAFFYHFWTSAWPKLNKKNKLNPAATMNEDTQRLIGQTTNAIEGFVNFGCIATGVLQIIALNFNQTIWQRYFGWLRTITSKIPSEEVVRSVIQEEYFHNFRTFKDSAIYRIIMSKSRKTDNGAMPMAA
jgi:hypothetical protein